jgi:hypothetical protein
MKYLILLFLLFVNQIQAQSKKEIKQLGIKEVREYKLEFKNGQQSKKYLKEIRRYDRHAQLVYEEHFNSDSSSIKKEIYVYENSRLISETKAYLIDKPNETEEIKPFQKRVFKYVKDEVAEEIELDSAGNILSRTLFTRNRFGDKTEENKYNAKGELKKRTVYKYDKLGLRILKSEFKPNGELKEETITEYVLN